MIARVNVFRHLLLDSGRRPYTITLISNAGMRGVCSPTLLSRNISMCRRLDSTLPAKSQNTPWKPLSDPVANRATMRRVVCVAGITGAILLSFVILVKSLLFTWIPIPDRVKEMRKRV